MVYPGIKEDIKSPVKKQDTLSLSSDKQDNDSGTVTLTKGQFRALLEAFSQAQLNSDDLPLDKEKSNASSISDANGNKLNGRPAISSVPDIQLPICPVDTMLPDASITSSKSENSSPAKTTCLTKLEKKRMQWEKEKAEVIEWNPWGKPGAGAPKRALPIASVAPRTENLSVAGIPYSTSLPNSIPSCLTSPIHRGGNNFLDHLQESTPYSKSFSNIATKPVPPVFKSSINFGSPEEDFLSIDGTKKQQWVKDLEEQRRNNQLQDNEWMNGNMEDIDSISVSVDGSSAPLPLEGGGGRTYARGQGFKLDPIAASMAEERRQKAQEYQQAIRRQMEEKQRRLMQEKERKIREEAEEEQRLIAERARLQAEYEQEQFRQKQKQDMETQKQAAMQSAVQKAEAEAIAEKKNRKVNKQRGGEEIVNDYSNQSSPRKQISRSVTPVSPPKIIEPKQDKGNYEALRTSQQTATVKPLLSTSTHKLEEKGKLSPPTPRKELGVQTIPETEESTGYIVNRVLTPSVYRVKSRSNLPKDFGTQTDNHYGRWIGDDADSTDHSTSSLCPGPVNKRLNRVQHSKPYKASRRQYNLDNLNERPKWGANQPTKTFIRMTERDPHFTKRKKMQELRKQHWEQEMAAQQAIKNARKGNATIYPTLRGRRIRSSSDFTAGFSSSEFESSHIPNDSPRRVVRSHRSYGFRSVCGSAEDVAYHEPSSTYSSSRLPYVHGRRNSQSSENVQSIIGGSEPTSSRFSFPEVMSSNGRSVSMRRKWHSHETFEHQDMRAIKDSSSQVPLIHGRHSPMSSPKPSSLPSSITHSRRKWSDQESFDPENVALSHARLLCSSSGGGDEGIERDSLSSADSSKKSVTSVEQNPLICPEVITRRPTPRQDRILHNLSSLKQGLLQKQKELETLIRNPPHVL